MNMQFLYTHDELILSNRVDKIINEGLLAKLGKLGKLLGNIKGLFKNLWDNVEKTAKVNNDEVFDELRDFDENKLSGFTILKKTNYVEVKNFLVALSQYADQKYEYAIDQFTSVKKIKDSFDEDDGGVALKVFDSAVSSKLSELTKQMDGVLNDSETGKNYKKSLKSEAEIIISNLIIDEIKTSERDNSNSDEDEEDDSIFTEFENNVKNVEKEIENDNKEATKVSDTEMKKIQQEKDDLVKAFGFTPTKSTDMNVAINNVSESYLKEEHSEDDKEIFKKYEDKDSDKYFNIEEIEKDYPDVNGIDLGIALKISKAIIKSNFNKYKKNYADNLEIQQYIANVTLRIVIQSLTTGEVKDDLLAAATALMTTKFGVGLNAPVIKDGADDATTFTMIIKNLNNTNVLKTTIDNTETISKFKNNYGKIAKVLINKTKELNKNNKLEL